MKQSFILVFTCPNCSKDHKRRINVYNDAELNAESLVCEKAFDCECGVTFCTPPYNELYIRL